MERLTGQAYLVRHIGEIPKSRPLCVAYFDLVGSEDQLAMLLVNFQQQKNGSR